MPQNQPSQPNSWNDPPEPTALQWVLAYILVWGGGLALLIIGFAVFGVYFVLFPIPTLFIACLLLR